MKYYNIKPNEFNIWKIQGKKKIIKNVGKREQNQPRAKSN